MIFIFVHLNPTTLNTLQQSKACKLKKKLNAETETEQDHHGKE
jgi:hypothetical protein